MQLFKPPAAALFALARRMLERSAPKMSDAGTMADQTIENLSDKLDRLIAAVSRLAMPPAPVTDLAAADCFVWVAEPGFLEPVQRVNRIDIGLIRGIDRVRDILIDNTRRFAAGLPANNALLWGARGMGKSSLVKAVHAAINALRRPRGAAQADRDPPRGRRHACRS